MKTILRVDNNETLRIEPMTLAEMQGGFGFNAGEDPRPQQ
jgi:hypothetical protein